ncbi:MAG: NRDE family protein [Gammaproteobacteria bacterium]|nr:NRDE family protein [Gammaproteobacteria bacterium]
MVDLIMCIVVLAWQTVPNKPLVLFGNRDEFYQRDAAPLSIWPQSSIIAGRDLQSGGTWLGITASGRWAIITNFRRKENPPPNAITRGALVADYLEGDSEPLAFLQSVNPAQYAGFNLIVGTFTDAAILGNRGTPPQTLSQGIHTLSNALLDTEWPKTKRLFQGFSALDLTANDDLLVASGFNLLNDETKADIADLPNTGIGTEMEEVLSSIRIDSPIYGTRVSSVLVLGDEGYTFAEKTWRPVEGGVVRMVGEWIN